MISLGCFLTLLSISTGSLVVALQNQQHQFYQMKDQFSPQVPPHQQVYRNELPPAPLQQLPNQRQHPTSNYNYQYLVPPESLHKPLVRNDWSSNLQHQQPSVPQEMVSKQGTEQLLKRLKEAQQLLPKAGNSIQEAHQMNQKPPVQQPQYPTRFHQMPPEHNKMSIGLQQQQDQQHQQGTQHQFNMLNKATREQKELKARLIKLANKVTNNTPSLPSSTEALFRVDTKTGAITPVDIDPHAAIEQEKLREVMKALSAKRLPVDRLGPLLGLGGNPESQVEPLQNNARLEPHMAIDQPGLVHNPTNQLRHEAEHQHQPDQIVAKSPIGHQYNNKLVDVEPMVKQTVIDPNRPMGLYQQTSQHNLPSNEVEHREPVAPLENRDLSPPFQAPDFKNKPNSHPQEQNQMPPTDLMNRQQDSMRAPEASEHWLPEESLLPDEPAERVRFELDDRIKRISDLLYFRPEFMNLLLRIDDASELSPLESEFKRMVLCNSDEQFCNPSQSPDKAKPYQAELDYQSLADQHLKMEQKEAIGAQELSPKSIEQPTNEEADYRFNEEYQPMHQGYHASFGMQPQDSRRVEQQSFLRDPKQDHHESRSNNGGLGQQATRDSRVYF